MKIRFRHREPDRNDVEKDLGLGNPTRMPEIGARMKHQLISPRVKLVDGEDRNLRSPIVIRV